MFVNITYFHFISNVVIEMFKVVIRLYNKFYLILILYYNLSYGSDVCYKYGNCLEKNELRYLFYDVNAPEGFNLRRDVYMRFAVLAHQMQTSNNHNLNKFKLVLPPWSHLMHWNYSELPEHIPWGLYFDINSLKLFAPVIEMHEFFSGYGKKYYKVIIEEVYTLQHFEDMFESGNFQDRSKIDKCQSNYDLTFFYYSNITSKNHYCLSYHGPATKLKEVFLNTTAETILINHAEVALHEVFGNKLYWQARRSMRFNKELVTIAADFRKAFLNSTDEADNTVLPHSWINEKLRRNARGGPYLGVHLRRRDFIRSRPLEAPHINTIAQQITKALKMRNLDTVFIATDESEDFDTLSKKLHPYKLLKYIPSDSVRKKFKDGGIAIIDQIICSHARFFIGTHESTFTFRIQEEREILGFPSDTTFNCLCKAEDKCNKPSVWNIVY